MAVLFLKVTMIRDRRAWVVVRAAKLPKRLRRPLALMRMVAMLADPTGGFALLSGVR